MIINLNKKFDGKRVLRGFWIMMVTLFLVLLFAQVIIGFSAGLFNNTPKNKIVADEIYLYAHGVIKLQAQIPKNIIAQLLLNGQVVQTLTQDEFSINVKEGDFLSLVVKKGKVPINFPSDSLTEWKVSLGCQGISLKTGISTESGMIDFLIHQGINTIGSIVGTTVS